MAFIEKEYDLDNKTLTVTVGGEALEFDSNELSDAMRLQFLLHGMSQKLGDAAAGKEGQDAIDAINKVADGLAKGDWTVRAPASEKVSKKSILDKFASMPEGKEKKIAEDLLRSLGIIK